MQAFTQLLLCMVLLMLPALAKAQHLIVDYQVTAKPDRAFGEVDPEQEQRALAVRGGHYILYVEGDRQLFTKGERSTAPSLQGPDAMIVKGDSCYTFNYALYETHLVRDTIAQHNWEITEEEKQIGGKTCYKAVDLLRKEVAWFCPELPYSTGPRGMGGLPGLIFLLDTPRYSYVLSAVEIVDETAFTLDLSQLKSISRQAFKERQRKIYQEMGVKSAAE